MTGPGLKHQLKVRPKREWTPLSSSAPSTPQGASIHGLDSVDGGR